MEHFLAQSVIHFQPIMQIATYRMNSSSLFSMTLKSEHSTAQECLTDVSGTLDKIVPGSSLFLTAGDSSLQNSTDRQSSNGLLSVLQHSIRAVPISPDHLTA